MDVRSFIILLQQIIIHELTYKVSDRSFKVSHRYDLVISQFVGEATNVALRNLLLGTSHYSTNSHSYLYLDNLK
jgi:hypothetical protein